MNIEQMLAATELALSREIETVSHYGKNIADKISNILIGNSLDFYKYRER